MAKTKRLRGDLPLFCVPGSGTWPGIREAVGSALHHAALLRGSFRVRLVTDWAAEFEAEGTLAERGIEVAPRPDLPAPPEACGVGTYYEGRAHFFGLKVRILRDLAAAEPPGRVCLLLDSDAVALRDLPELPAVLPADRDLAMVRDRFPDPVASRTRPRGGKRFATEEEWASMEADGSYSTSTPTFNSGVILLRAGEPVRRLAAAWLDDWLEWRNGDQQNLSRILHLRPVLRRLITELPTRYNRFVAWQASRAAPGEPESDLERMVRDGECAVAHNHATAATVFKRTDAWELSAALMRRAGLRPGMSPRT